MLRGAGGGGAVDGLRCGSRWVCRTVPPLMVNRVLNCQDEILYMGFDAAKIGLPADFVLTDYSKVCPSSRVTEGRGVSALAGGPAA